MYNLSLTSSQLQMKQNIDDKTSVKDMQVLNETENNYESPTTPDHEDYFQHNFSNLYQSSRYKRGYYFVIH